MSLENDTYPLKELNEGASVFSGFAFKSKDFVDEGIPVVKIKNIQNKAIDLSEIQFFSYDNLKDKHEKFLLKNNDVLIAMTGQGSLGRVGRLKLDDNQLVLLNQRVGKFQTDEKNLHLNYLYHVISSDMYEKILFDRGTGSGQPNLSPEIILGTEIPMPDLNTQKKIAFLLDNIDNLITINKKINKNLEQLIHTIFNYWFISFDKFKNVTFKQSPLGDIPDGWDCGALRDLLTLTKNPIKADETNGLPYLPIDIIPMNSLGISELKSDEEANSSLITFNKNDILIGAMRVYFHRVVISPCSGVTRSTCFVLNPKHEYHLSYLLLLCNLDRTIQYAQNTSKGTTMPYAVWDNGLGDMEIIIPPDDILMEFHELVFPIIEKIRDSFNEINKLTKLRDTLLPKLMSGEIDVSEINCDLE